MKLIDADELMEKIYSVKYLRKIKSKQLIDECKRIDAIPIERLEQEIDCYIDLGLNSVAKELKTIVDDWRKENEQKTNI